MIVPANVVGYVVGWFLSWSSTVQIDNILWGVASATPLFIVYLLAAVLGLINLRTYSPAARYAALGGMTGVLVMISTFILQQLLWANVAKPGGDFESTILLSRVVGIVANIVLAVGMAMIVYAVFVGRKPAPREDDEEPTAPASRPRS